MTAERHHRGRSNYHAGISAELCIEKAYVGNGHEVIARRWRGQGGEIDLVFRKDDVLFFVEVKQARDFERAAESLRRAQMRRIASAAEEFLGNQPNGALTECRFDVGLVDGRGAHCILENVFMLH